MKLGFKLPATEPATSDDPSSALNLAPRERVGLVKASAGYRFAVLFGLGIGIVGFIACVLLGEFKVGVLLDVGLLLGYWNTAMVVSSTSKFAGSIDHDKKKYMGGVFRRLMYVTAIAAFIMYAYRPQGMAVLFGLAFFQFTVIGSSAGILAREVRQK